MKCHVLSRSACARHISNSPCGHEAVVSGRGSGYSVRLPRLRVSGMGLSSRSLFVPFGAAAGLSAERPFSARIACARVRAFRAGARFARLIAHVRARQAQGLPSVSQGFFRTGAKQETKRRRERRFLLSHFSMDFSGSSLVYDLFLTNGTFRRYPRHPNPAARQAAAGLATGSSHRIRRGHRRRCAST